MNEKPIQHDEREYVVRLHSLRRHGDQSSLTPPAGAGWSLHKTDVQTRWRRVSGEIWPQPHAIVVATWVRTRPEEAP